MPKNTIRYKRAELSKSYEPKAFEANLYEFWESSGCFEVDDTPREGQEPYCIVIPPPNVTGILHVGHALTNTIQDILIRWRRMCGDQTLWLPGTDHAGISTQVQVEKSIAPKTRHDLGREEFLKKTWRWKEDHHGIISSQLRRLGSSLAWSRERFTMDDGMSNAVREVFVRLYEEGLVYRGKRLINWCTRCNTALSDLEVIPKETQGSLWHIFYPFIDGDGKTIKKDGEDFGITIATTRPETLLGDTAVAVHPEDDRYKECHGQKARLPLVGREIPIVLDEYVDPEFGSGGLKVTPAHDFNDHDIGLRHDLPQISVIDQKGKITADGGTYAGLSVKEARKQIVADLKENGHLVKVEDNTHQVGRCQRCDTVAEPLLSKQWFVLIDPLAKPAIEAVESGRVKFTPKNWEKTYFEWMNNIRDWCISRQLWWGHQIPAWHCQDCQAVTVARSEPDACSDCSSSNIKQDEDVLDTWFSSALWPFATLGWPEKTPALKAFYPNTVLETGFDIIFFWVARMIMMGLHFMKDVPFRDVYLHAMVRDEKGDKMSKSKGNVVDPLVVMDEYGTDPLRFTLAIMAGQGMDIKLSMKRVEGYKAFCNKLWNAVKFFHFHCSQGEDIKPPREGLERWLANRTGELHPVNRWILSRLQVVSVEVHKKLEKFELNNSSQALYDFIWGDLCDWFIEFSKISLADGGEKRQESLYTLHYILEDSLKLLHPFMPFVTEELWQSLPWTKTIDRGTDKIHTIMLQDYPVSTRDFVDPDAIMTIEALQSVIERLRTFRGENGISVQKEFPVQYATKVSNAVSFLKLYEEEICTLARVSRIERVTHKEAAKDTEAVLILSRPAVEFRINMEDLIDKDEETKRLKKEIERTTVNLNRTQSKLQNASFVDKAPANVVQNEKLREKEFRSKLAELEASLERLSK